MLHLVCVSTAWFKACLLLGFSQRVTGADNWDRPVFWPCLRVMRSFSCRLLWGELRSRTVGASACVVLLCVVMPIEAACVLMQWQTASQTDVCIACRTAAKLCTLMLTDMTGWCDVRSRGCVGVSKLKHFAAWCACSADSAMAD